MSKRPVKRSHTVICSSAFREEVEALALRRGVNAADIARSVLLIVPAEIIETIADPGEPRPGDRETVVLKSGPSAGRRLRRKPRLQLRLPSGHPVKTVRRALAFALALDAKDVALDLAGAAAPDQEKLIADLYDENERLLTLLSILSFDPLPEGPATPKEALHLLGFPPDSNPDRTMIKAKFKLLASIHHPDSGYGDNRRMSQLNMAMDVLRRSGRI